MGIILTPFAWLLMCFYDLFQSYGLALILFALVIKLVLFPFSLKGKKSMIQMNLLSPSCSSCKSSTARTGSVTIWRSRSSTRRRRSTP